MRIANATDASTKLMRSGEREERGVTGLACGEGWRGVHRGGGGREGKGSQLTIRRSATAVAVSEGLGGGEGRREGGEGKAVGVFGWRCWCGDQLVGRVCIDRREGSGPLRPAPPSPLYLDLSICCCPRTTSDTSSPARVGPAPRGLLLVTASEECNVMRRRARAHRLPLPFPPPRTSLLTSRLYCSPRVTGASCASERARCFV